MRTRAERGFGIALLLAAILLAIRPEAPPPATLPDLSAGPSKRGDEAPGHPAKSPRRSAKRQLSREPSSVDRLWTAKILLKQGDLQAAREQLEHAIALDATNNEAQFLRDTLSEGFRPMSVPDGSKAAFWSVQLEPR